VGHMRIWWHTDTPSGKSEARPTGPGGNCCSVRSSHSEKVAPVKFDGLFRNVRELRVFPAAEACQVAEPRGPRRPRDRPRRGFGDASRGVTTETTRITSVPAPLARQTSFSARTAGSFGTVNRRLEKPRLKAFPKRSGDFSTYITSRTARRGVSRSKLVENGGGVLVH